MAFSWRRSPIVVLWSFGMIEIALNGAWVSSSAMNVAEFVRERSLPQAGVAVAVNGSVIPKSEWVSTALRSSDRVEIVTAAAGG
jgi:sulfur carrier protein